MSPEPDVSLPGGPLDAAFAAGRRQRLRSGAVLFEEGDISNKVVLLLAGRVKVSTLSEDGRETVLGFRVRATSSGSCRPSAGSRTSPR